ncbi:sodium-translocating pyrophosphatase [Promethearchaeum syntrophicum]|uniref:K(+)-insensitive pyrophosphate-energized proton pump n=1 Tax=Promethearchaeum syntrophicum TaxID=2594042 RepID=A0A5B9DEW9_9ARCH|nr:sodium-translocating pyrophosphatase [Candidatus Prometheoarchaeum syntrophicum]QEE17276.1 K(+)-stimulated pyrophosphate-energized sodium pump [Candidatus Prometheoarchaeum syntrophicum]
MLLEVILEVWTLWFVLAAAIASFIVAFILKKRVDVADPGNEEMVKVQGYIRDGASTFIKRQYITLAYFVGGLAIIIALVYWGNIRVPWYLMVISYLAGSGASAWAGWLGMKVGVDANAKTAQASTKGLAPAFNVSFFAGAVMGLIVVGAALGGVWLLYFVFGDPLVILGFSFGASSIALFAKAGGGIYTKTADVAADLVGKVEYSLPEDDPRNPASIADNVGDNVGDIAGMGADLFDSYVASILGAMLLAFSWIGARGYTTTDINLMTSFPLVISAAGLIASILGIFIIGKMGKSTPGKALNLGTYIATLIFIAVGALFTFFMTLTEGVSEDIKSQLWRNLWAGVFGVASGLVIGLTTDYFTNDEKRPTQLTAESSEQGHALNILTGFSYGLLSVAPPIIGIVIAMGVAYWLDGLIGVANASTGMLAIVGTIVSNDAFGPIVDNARGIAEQGGLSEKEIALCDRLDSAGNTAKAITKGFAIGAAALTVLALLYAFMEEAKHNPDIAQALKDMETISLDLMTPAVMISALLGTAVPMVYSAVLIMAVDKNAQVMVKEIRRQFEENPAILKGTEPADFEKCIDIATKGSLKELIVPILLSVVSPLVVGVLFGVQGLGAFLASTILIGFVFALLLSNSGGMWDNAKKYIEDGHLGGKGTFAHAAAVTGDTVGDPFKDTAGPSINTLITVMSLTASMFLSLFMLDIFNNGQGLLMNLFV